jgi:hypothetical protein
MKAILEFNLPDDNNDFLLAQRGRDYFSDLMEISNLLRANRKYDVSDRDTLTQITDVLAESQIYDIE